MDFNELRDLAVSLRPKERAPVGYEMSTETLRRLVVAVGPMDPTSNQSDRLWGIPIYINEALPVDNIKPLYRNRAE